MLVIQPQCKHKHEPPHPALLEAVSIQESALRLGKSADSLVNAKISQTQDTFTIAKLNTLRKQIQEWKTSRIEIPGVPQDHSLHDHSDHSGHHHDHEKPQDHGLSPDQMKEIQTQWKQMILDIINSLNQ